MKLKAVTLLKLSSFPGIFQGFWSQEQNNGNAERFT